MGIECWFNDVAGDKAVFLYFKEKTFLKVSWQGGTQD
jgi:hypothetical protein